MGKQTSTQMIINPAQQIHGQEEIDSATEVIKSGRWAEGPKSLEFRKILSDYLGVKYVCLTNSGSSANLAALMALTTHWIDENRRLGPDTEVITPALCFPTTVSPIKYTGATPVFVDVDKTWSIDIKEVEKAITEKTRAIMFAHNLGNPANMDEIMRIGNKHKLWVIEDNCDSFGSEWDGEKTGSIGHIGTSSFYPAHHISTGEGGAVYTNYGTLYRAIQSMINWGRDCYCGPFEDDTCKLRYQHQLGGLPKGYDHKNTFSELGFNLKSTDISAALGIEQMKRLDGFTKKRRENHDFFMYTFSRHSDEFELPKKYKKADPSWFGYVIKLTDKAPFTKNEMIDALQHAGIGSRSFFCGNITRQPCLWKKEGYRVVGDLKVSDDIMNNAFWIGVHPGIGTKERKYMIDVIDKFLERHK